MSTDLVTSKACDGCGQAVPYEPMMVGDVDLGKMLPHFCTSCTSRQREDDAAKEREAIEAAREAEVRRVIPPKMRRTDTAHPGFNLDAWRVVDKWTPHQGRWLVLLGETGLSKSRMLALHAMRLIRRGMSVEWTTSLGFQDAALREQDRDAGARERLKARESLALWKACDVLVVDDFLKEAGDGPDAFSRVAERHFFDVFDHRFNFDLPVLLSCNSDPRAMLKAGHFSKDRGAPLVGRIIEGAGEILRLVTTEHQLEL